MSNPPKFQLQDADNVLALHERFWTKKIVDDDELQFPYIDDKLCILDPKKTTGAKSKLKHIKDKFVELRMTDPIIANFIQKYGKESTYRYKAVMCMIFFILSKIHDVNNNNVSLLEVVIRDDPKYKTVQITDVVKFIGSCIAYGSSTQTMVTGLESRNIMDKDVRVKTLITKLEADYKVLNTMPITHFFLLDNRPSIFTNLPRLSEGLLDYVYQHVRDHLAAEYDPIYDQPVDKMGYIRSKLLPLDTATCVHIHDDDDVLGQPFTQYTMDDIGMFININKGYCFAYTYLGTNIMGSRGNIGIRALGTIPPANRASTIKGLSQYYSKVSPLENQQADLFDIVAAYKGSERTVLIKWLQTKNMSDYFQNLDSESGPLKLTKPLTHNYLTLFFEFMINDYADVLMLDNMQLILKLSCGTLFDLIGFLGWVCYSDDSTIANNDSGNYFVISQFCIGLFTDVCDKLKTIPIDDATSPVVNNVFDAIKDFRFGKSTLAELLKGVETTCIHGVGASFIRYYMNAYTSVNVQSLDWQTNIHSIHSCVAHPRSIKRPSNWHRLLSRTITSIKLHLPITHIIHVSNQTKLVRVRIPTTHHISFSG